MHISPEAERYRQNIVDYAGRSYTRTIFSGYHYRFLSEIIGADESYLPKRHHDLDLYSLAHMTVYGSPEAGVTDKQLRCTYSEIQDLVAFSHPHKGQGQILFLKGHLPGSWICEVGAKYSVAPEFFRQHIHLWRSTEGPVLHAITRMPSATYNKGLVLRINTLGFSTKESTSLDPFSSLILDARRRLLPDNVEWMPARLAAAPGGSYVRGHAYLSNLHFLIEQNISITIEPSGDGWTAILWTDVGGRDLSMSREYHRFIEHMTAVTETGHRDIRLSPSRILGNESDIKHPWPLPIVDTNDTPENDGTLAQTAAHLPSELHIMLDDHVIAGLDPLYALAPVLLFAAASENQLLSTLQRWYDIISATKWDPKHSSEHLEQLILHKHLLDDHAGRHEEVLRFMDSPVLAEWAMQLSHDQSVIANRSKNAARADYEFLLSRFRQLSLHYQEAISVLVSATSLAESQKQIRLATQVTKLTVLATVFLPLSYCTSIFGMNFVELERLSIWVWAAVTIAVGLSTLALYHCDETGPFLRFTRMTVAIFGKKCRISRDSGTVQRRKA